jgi:hypothetical protein
MKTKYKYDIDGHTIISHISNPAFDPEETKKIIVQKLKKEMPQKSIKEIEMLLEKMPKKEAEKLYNENLFFRTGGEAELIEDNKAAQINEKLRSKGKNKLLLNNGDFISDYRDTEYHIKTKGKWKKEKIERIGIDLPAAAVLEENLTIEQHEEINNQKETERIASLSLIDKAKELEQKLRALANEAVQKSGAAELLGEAFDKKVWFNSIKTELQSKYKITDQALLEIKAGQLGLY